MAARLRIAVTGNIGSGKSTMVSALAQALGLAELQEPFRRNPYLERFYADHHAYAVRSQLWFQADALQRHLEAERLGRAVQEHTPETIHEVMTRAMHDAGIIDAEDFGLLGELAALHSTLIRAPDVIVHLTAPTPVLLERIETRGRPFERHIDAAYLEHIEAAARRFGESWPGPIVSVDTSQLDSRLPPGLGEVIRRIEAAAG